MAATRRGKAASRRKKRPRRVSTEHLREELALQLGGHAPDALAIALLVAAIVAALGLFSDLAGPAGDPLAAVALADDLACDSLSMSQADSDAQTTAQQLVERAGGVSPLKGYLVALGADRSLTVVFDFENDDQAEKNARSREALAGAEDPGQLLSYDELFAVDDVEQDGHRVVLTGTTVADSAPLSNLSAGPVLLASC
jgi:hypothetical protein